MDPDFKGKLNEMPKISTDRKNMRKAQKNDESYWGMPIWERIYFRLVYALAGFLIIGGFFGLLGAPNWLQYAMGGTAALGILVFRAAYPNGFTGFIDRFQKEALESAQQLADGDMSNVNQTLVKHFEYPTHEQVQKYQDETPSWDEAKKQYKEAMSEYKSQKTFQKQERRKNRK